MSAASTEVSNEAVHWEDVTALFRDAASMLTNANPMLCSKEFSLQESMSATELMDPKTDQCFGIEGSQELKDLLQPKFPEGYCMADLASLLGAMVVNEVAFFDGASVIESTHNCLFSWEDSWKSLINGNLNMEYIDELRRTQSEKRQSSEQSLSTESTQFEVIKRVIWIYSLSQQRCLDYTMKSITTADIFEDEDYHQSNVTINVNREIECEVIFTLLKDLICELSASPLGTTGLPDKDTQQVLCFLQFRLELHLFCKSYYDVIHISPPRGVGYLSLEDSEIEKHRSQALENVNKLNAQMKTLKEHLVNAIKITSDHPHSMKNPKNEFAFEGIAGKLMSSSPKRTIVLKTLQDSLQHLVSICSELTEVGNWILETAAEVRPHGAAIESTLRKYKPGCLTIDSLLNHGISFSSKKTHLLTRSAYFTYTQIIYHDLPHLIILSMDMRSFPSDLVAQCISNTIVNVRLVDLLQQVFYETFKCLAAHRNRTLIRVERLLQSYGTVLEDASYIDSIYTRIVHKLPLDISIELPEEVAKSPQQWCYYFVTFTCAKLIDIRMGLMIEYSLISPKEMDFFYWYWDFICSVFIFSNDRLRNHKKELYNSLHNDEVSLMREKRIKELKDSGKYTAKTFKQLNSREEEVKLSELAIKKLDQMGIQNPYEESEHITFVEEEYFRGKGQLCKALFRIFSYCAKIGIIDKTENKYSSWESLFSMRFEVLQYMGGISLLTYNDFLKVLHFNSESSAVKTEYHHVSIAPSSQIIETASKQLDLAKKTFEDLKKIKAAASSTAKPSASGGGAVVEARTQRTDPLFLDLILPISKIIISNKINNTKNFQAELAKNGAFTPVGKLSLDFKFHPHFPVVTIHNA